MEKTRIFISYKRKNKDQVFSIVKKIETQLGVKCWVDLDGIESSAQFASKICKAIDTAEVVLFMHSSVHLDIDFEEDWTIKELIYAHAKKKRVVLVKLDNAPLDNIFLMEYGSKNNIDSQDETQFQKLLKDLKVWMGISEQVQEETSSNTNVHIVQNNTNKDTPVDYIDQRKYDLKNIVDQKATAEEKELCNLFIEMTRKDRIKANELKKEVEQLATKGITEAEYALGFGESYQNLQDLRTFGNTRYRKAEQWLERAAIKGHVKAQSKLAEIYYWGNETEKAIHWAILASKEKDLVATLTLAWSYRRQKDHKKYMDAINLAAEQQNTLQVMNIHNPSMEYGRLLLENRNHHEAIKWFDVAIELAYDLDQKSEAIYYKAEALYEQGNKLKALICLENSPGEDYGYHSKYSIPELRDKIKSEINPFSIFSKK